MSRPKVLIIDDEVALTRILQLALEAEEEFEVHVLNNPLDVLETMRSVVPDVIVLDIIMPGKNGLEVAEEIRVWDAYREIPIIFLSATAVKRESGAWLNTDEGMYKKLDSKMLEEGTLLEKPVTTEVLLAALRHQLDK